MKVQFQRVENQGNGLLTSVKASMGSPLTKWSDKGRKSDLIERIFEMRGLGSIVSRVNKARKLEAERKTALTGTTVKHTSVNQLDILKEGFTGKVKELAPTEEDAMKFGRAIANAVGYKSFFSLTDVQEVYEFLIEDYATDERGKEFVTLAGLNAAQLEAVAIASAEDDNSEVLEEIIETAQATA